ncbi:MAG: DUF2262 domain-containing protein [Akkermansiaceae bacterium]|nr:DUF2262 domain-containing protein [Armatimonadota bacterium]
MPSDVQAIQGLWKVESILRDGATLGYDVTHWEFDGNRVQEIAPGYVDGSRWATFELDPTTTPKRIDTTHERTDRDGKVTRRTHKECYELSGDTLRIGGSRIFGEYPEAISDQISVVKTLTRYSGPRPQTKQPAGKTPWENPVFGFLYWDDNSDQWEASVEILPGRKVGVFLSPDDKGDAEAIATGQAFLEWLTTHESDAREYAAREMAEGAEEWRDPDVVPDEITYETFAARITLSEISIEADGTATLWYDDDDMFGGHVITVSINNTRTFVRAEMMG